MRISPLPPPCCRWGKLWNFSSAKLESRGKKMKGIVRRQSSARPYEAKGKEIKKKGRGRGGKDSKPRKNYEAKDFYITKGHNNSQMRSVLARMTSKEHRRLSDTATGKATREREQLVNLGKMDRKPCVKTDENVPERWAGLVPQGVDFTVEGLLISMVQGKIKPLYDRTGKAQPPAE